MIIQEKDFHCKLFVKKNGFLRFSTIENWSKNMYNLNTKRARVEENASVGALSVITKNVDKNSLAITRSPLKIFKDWVLDRKKNN